MDKTIGQVLACCFCFLLALSTNVYADAATGLGSITKITNNNGSGTHGFVISPSTSPVNPANCSVSDGRYAVGSGDSDYQEKAAQLMAAYLSGKPIQFWISSATDDCLWGLPRINYIDIEN